MTRGRTPEEEEEEDYPDRPDPVNDDCNGTEGGRPRIDKSKAKVGR